MGKVVVEKKRKKKKGRPSLLDLQKRNLKLQKQLLKKHNKNILNNNNNNSKIINNNINNKNITPKKVPLQSPKRIHGRSPVRRSTRRNPNPNSDFDEIEIGKKVKKVKVVDDEEDEDEDEDDELEEGDGEDVDGDGDGDGDGDESENSEEIEGKNHRKRKIGSISNGSDGIVSIDDKLQVEKQSVAVIKQADTEQGSSKLEDGPSTPLPDKKLLLFILDRLQKKDTYGVFADPVDAEELPDYHEIIDNPMDFSTVRKKLEDGSYGHLEDFEKDIYLICSNAMQYNAPDTIYFRQAGSIQELAKKNFDNLRQDSDDNELDPEPKVVRRGRPPKNLKRPGRPPLVRANSDFSEATVATAGGTTNRSNNEHRKGPPQMEKYGSTESFARALLSSRNSEPYMGRSAEKFDRPDDMFGSAAKGISMKYGKRQIVLDETRRNTYKHSCALASRHEPSVLNTFLGERKQLIAVGLHTEYGYARSLANFAAKLGPVAWKVASRKIEKCLPSGIKFGPGWVGENEAPQKPIQELPNASCQSSSPVTVPTQDLVQSGGNTLEQKPQVENSSEVNQPAVPTKLNNEPNNTISSPSVSCASNGANSTLISPEINPSSIGNMARVNGVNGSYGLSVASTTGKPIGSANPSMPNFKSSPSCSNIGNGEAELPANSSIMKAEDGSSDVGRQPKVCPTPPDLNVGFQTPGSPSSGKTDSIQPDLALQL
ncbi:uncharacterized protein LOC141599467 [Silene latifolia]|uniref:uncharacterized protein LOC141599467 n=1 Tax=Silene latifolia TaxID=37657 RepID=UPI003D7796CA